MKSLLSTVDNLLVHFAAGIMSFILNSIYGFVTVIGLLFIPFSFFEYSVSLAELDIIEIGSFIILVAVIWRFITRSYRLKVGLKESLKRFASSIASVYLILYSCCYMFVVTEITTQGSIGIEYLNHTSESIRFALVLMTIFAVYAATPLIDFLEHTEKPVDFDASKNPT
ncbi:hypothetical protein AMS58_01305 [Pseudoalteromonas porphyrae]|uniref:hypothetical protein n=1 Tax=Pseudoalteromonas porphyrae TaxID=187330 RepID=UPI0006BAA1AF|nr:hypothetical protein [Pseudoalteromonas porphyrae]KPH96231.1 hypothetical protein AMS58_01305 [Pseudoalteromonas porphyrae]